MKGKYERLPKKYSKELGDIVHSCLMKDYNKRPSIEELMIQPSNIFLMSNYYSILIKSFLT